MLLRALFVTAVGTVEPLVTRLVLLLFYYASPQSYRSLADPALEREARRLCFGSAKKWRKALVDKLSIAIAATAVDWDRLAVLWEDRNVIAHRGSITDAQHSARTGKPEGSIINPGADAVQSAIQFTKYAPRIARHGGGCLVSLSAASSEWASQILPHAVQDVPVLHYSWDSMRKDLLVGQPPVGF